MDFFLRSPPPAPSLCRPSADKEPSPDLRLIEFTLLSMKVLNSVGANSGCIRAGTQNNRALSSPSAFPLGGALGMPKLELKEGRSGSPAVFAFIDMRRSACKLLNSWATASGFDSYSMSLRGNWVFAVSELDLVRSGWEGRGLLSGSRMLFLPAMLLLWPFMCG